MGTQEGKMASFIRLFSGWFGRTATAESLRTESDAQYADCC